MTKEKNKDRFLCNINDKFRVMHDALNLILQEKTYVKDSHQLINKDRIGDELWVNYGYYNNMGHILNVIIKDIMKGRKCKTIKDYLEEYKKLQTEMQEIVDQVKDIRI